MCSRSDLGFLMASRNTQLIRLRIPTEVFTLAQAKARALGLPPEHPGKTGGVSVYVRSLLYSNLNLDLDPSRQARTQ